MKTPDEARWARVEELAEEISRLAPGQVSERLSQLAAAGEAPTVLTLLGTWLTLPAPPTALSAGILLGGRYLLREKLGEGGMGAVWRASQELIARDVAVKIIHPALVTPALQARFAGEMKVLGQLDHPGIVKIFDAGVHNQADGTLIPFFAMDLIEGQPLDLWAAACRSQRVEILRVMSEICSALGIAHERQIVHRDLKPRNIIVRTNGQPVIVDFGIARLRGFVLGEEEGIFSGTPQYAAPEQHLGRDHDFRSGESVDIYALGAILFEALSGRKLFEFPRGASIADMRKTVLETPVPRLSQVLADSPPALEELVSRAVRRDPADRFYSIAALGRAIDRVAATLAGPTSPAPRWTPAVRAIIPRTSWVLTDKIGEGGAGEVWVGVHKQLGERRVFKFCDTEEKARTLKREVTLFRLLKERVGRNPHFITLHEVSLDEPPFYLMMDYVDARELEAWCAAQPGGLTDLPEATRLEIIIQAAEALQAAHEAGILHRDIKPANLLVRNEAAGLHLFIADFGIGQIVTDQLLRDVTRLGFTSTVSGLRTDRLSGTLLYLAPEVLEGSPATARSDIYSLGVVLWQLLAGNLHAALDPSDWPARIEDPILQEYLRRCLAGVPEKRWASAGELATSLRALPERRAAEERRNAEIKVHEQAAYRRGIFRTAVIAAGILLVIAALAAEAWRERTAAERRGGELALDQADALSRSDLNAGRKERGLRLLELPAKTSTNLAALRTAAASVFALTDMVKAPAPKPLNPARPLPNSPRKTGEVLRAYSADLSLLAIARDLDGLNGAIDLYGPESNQKRFTLTRKDFPWVPIAEPRLLSFSADNRMLAVGGAATSRHVLLFDCTNGALRSYIFHGSDPLCCAWHPGGRFIATGCADGSIKIWDINAAVSAKMSAVSSNQFDLPPALDVPALDHPLYLLEGQLGAVDHLVFSTTGKWLAALDHAGYLRVFTGFPAGKRRHVADIEAFADLPNAAPTLTIQTQIDHPDQVITLSAIDDSILMQRSTGSFEQLQLSQAALPEELQLAPDLADLAWDNNATQLCVITRTDSYWLHASPLESFFHQPGNNPVRVSWDNLTKSWILPSDDRLARFTISPRSDTPRLERISNFPLIEAVKGQASRTAMAAADDGRIAAYRGRHIQFFSNNIAAPDTASFNANGAGGRFQDLFWDTKGRLLGVIFATTNETMALESWSTSTDFPPKSIPLKPASLDCDVMAPANDGRNFVARGARTGLFLFDPASETRRVLNPSVAARQNAPLACTVDGRLLAMVVDPNIVRLIQLPSGVRFADLPKPHGRAAIVALRWDRSGSRLAGINGDGHVQLWNLAPWQQWLASHHFNN